MPKRTDLKKILVIGAGPIVIGQACEFDYSGSQACKALKEEGYEVVLVNSNPATIMTDPEMADRTYIEPITFDILEKIIEKERPDALLPTLGGQTGLNIATELAERGVLERFKVELIGANLEAIKKAEDRNLFKDAIKRIGVPTPRSEIAYSIKDAVRIAHELGFPVVIRPAYTLGGTGGGIAYNKKDLKNIVEIGLEASRINQALIEESVIGWKEYELEVMRDKKDNVVIICSIENLDPMGIHTGDSITVAPAQTLTDKEYQVLRDASIKIIREIGVETGGSNIQFAVNPDDGRYVAIEMNPRVSRSSALASKATGYPIAKIAAKLAIGKTLDEIPNDITKETPASFEPTLDYVVVKVPRFTFEKFPKVNQLLTTQMKSVGEVMAIGRTFEEALQKAVRSLEIGKFGIIDTKYNKLTLQELQEKLKTPTYERLFHIASAIQKGMSVNTISSLTRIDPWFIQKIKSIIELEDLIKNYNIETIPYDLFYSLKRAGFSDRQLASLLKSNEISVRKKRKQLKILPVFKMVDTCAAEFEAKTPYFYSTYEEEDEDLDFDLTSKKKIAIIGAGPNRIGQGIEFDYCCVHACFALKFLGIETIMINCNPETVSTDYDTSDKLYFEPLTFEDVLNVLEKEKVDGVIVQFGGQTPLNIASELEKQGIPIIGTSVESIDLAEDRERFFQVLDELDIPYPEHGIAFTYQDALNTVKKIGYPVMVRPSYVLGGRGMEVVYNKPQLEKYITDAVEISPSKPILVDKFLKSAIEIDVDAISDGEEVFVAGIMEHIEEAGIHSGDSACVLPPQSLSENIIKTIKEYTAKLANRLKVIGLLNIQYAVKNNRVYVLEANPRASRTVPYVSKAIGIPIAKIATKVMIGFKLKDLKIQEPDMNHVAVKESVFPFIKLPGADSILSPEMKSTGEVMGLDKNFNLAFYKAQVAAGMKLPPSGQIFITVNDEDKNQINTIAKKFKDLGYRILATTGTAQTIESLGLKVKIIKKIREGRPNIGDFIKAGKIHLIINTLNEKDSTEDDFIIRRLAIEHNIPYITTLSGAKAAIGALETIKKESVTVKSINEYLF